MVLFIFVACTNGQLEPVLLPYPDYSYTVNAPGWLELSSMSDNGVETVRRRIPGMESCAPAERFTVALRREDRVVGSIDLLTGASTTIQSNEILMWFHEHEVGLRGGEVLAQLTSESVTIEWSPSTLCTVQGVCEPYLETVMFTMQGPAVDWTDPTEPNDLYVDTLTRQALCDSRF